MNKNKVLSFSLLFSLSFLAMPILGQTQENGSINVTSEDSNNRIAPGEFLPISVKLVNFGSEKRVDVTINYRIFNNGDKGIDSQKEIYSETETVAVETTASFIKRIQIPYQFKPGYYNVITDIKYPYQEYPATSKFPFLVEEKIGGIFKSNLLIYGLVLLIVTAMTISVTYFFTVWRRRQFFSVVSHDYSNKPKDQIIYYDILSNIISQMRLRIGNNAIAIAQDMPNLKINSDNGYILEISDDPAKIIALLVARYEKLLGYSISFGLGKFENN